MMQDFRLLWRNKDGRIIGRCEQPSFGNYGDRYGNVYRLGTPFFMGNDNPNYGQYCKILWSYHEEHHTGPDTEIPFPAVIGDAHPTSITLIWVYLSIADRPIENGWGIGQGYIIEFDPANLILDDGTLKHRPTFNIYYSDSRYYWYVLQCPMDKVITLARGQIPRSQLEDFYVRGASSRDRRVFCIRPPYYEGSYNIPGGMVDGEGIYGLNSNTFYT